MNERIKELAGQALDQAVPQTWTTLTAYDLNKFTEVFAELIIRECGQVLVDNTPVVDLDEDWDKGYDRAMNDCIHHIYEHFGVEE